MSDFDADAPLEDDWNDRGDLAWNEFDWERYLREQDGAIQRYLGLYETLRRSLDRIDAVAEQMGWEAAPSDLDHEQDEIEQPEEAEKPASFDEGEEVYTLHKNPVFIATKAIYLGLRRSWEQAASETGRVPAPLAVAYLSSLHRGEEQASQAIHALDFGDYAMAVSLFKRALSALNQSLALLSGPEAERYRAVSDHRADALPRLFDLREIWLRIINECREELDRPVDE
jgi:hypothetical protein